MRPRRQYLLALTLWPALCQRRHREPASLSLHDTDEASVSPATIVSNRSYFSSYVADGLGRRRQNLVRAISRILSFARCCTILKIRAAYHPNLNTQPL